MHLCSCKDARKLSLFIIVVQKSVGKGLYGHPKMQRVTIWIFLLYWLRDWFICVLTV